MKITQLRAENFKRIRAVEITPDGDVVQIGGNNGEGKSSVLDAIWVALAGRSAAPPKPIRNGEQECTIDLDLGEIRVIRTFRDKGDRFTDTVKVESAEGLRYSSPQEVLDGLMGAIGFDPLDFARQKADRQAEMLLQIVPLSIDLDEFAEQDQSDFAKRRDVNRDIQALKGQIAGLPEFGDAPTKPVDLDALNAKLASAANTNSEIEQEAVRRRAMVADYQTAQDQVESLREKLELMEARATEFAEAIAAFEPLPPLVDTDAIRAEWQAGMATNRQFEQHQQRLALQTRLDGLQAESDAFTKAMAARDAARQSALTEARMPIDGLSFALDPKGKPIVLFGGVPFEQISTAEQIKASTAIAMAANPDLRVLRIRDGAMLDKRSMATIAAMAADQDFQLWIEVVGEGEGVGIIMEDGTARAATDPIDPAPKPAAEKPKAKAKAKEAAEDGKLL